MKQVDLTWLKLYRKSKNSDVFAHEGLWKLWSLCMMSANHKSRSVQIDGLVKPVLVQVGQFLTGRYRLHGDYHQWCKGYKRKSPSSRTLWRWLHFLEQMGCLTIESYSKYSLVTLTNWERHQGGAECFTEMFHENQGSNANFYLDSQKKRQNLAINNPNNNLEISEDCGGCGKKVDQQASSRRPADDHKQECIKNDKEYIGADAPLFSCQLFSIPESYLQKLQREYPGVDREQVLKLCSKIEDYCSDNPKRYKRNNQGSLKNPKLVLRNWVEKNLKASEEPRRRAYREFTEDDL
jgi:hypothetical protein